MLLIKFTGDNAQNTVTSTTEDGVLQIVISVVDKNIVKTAFEIIFGNESTYPQAIKDNGYSSKINVIIGTTTPNNKDNEITTPSDEDNETSNRLQNNNSSININKEAQEMSQIFSAHMDEYDGQCSLINVNSCIKLIQEFTSKAESPDNKIYCDNGVVYIEAISTGDIERIFKSYMPETKAMAISDNGVEYVSVKIVNPTSIPGEEGKTEEQKAVWRWLNQTYPGLEIGLIDAILSDEKNYTVEYDNEGNISMVVINEQFLQEGGFDDTTKSQIYSNQNPEKEDTADLGGVLLSPVFYLINFIADALISITGSVMDPTNALDFGLGVLTNTKPNPGYTSTFDYKVDTSSFIPTNLIGALFSEGSIRYQYPHLTYTPEEIFSGKIDLLSIDFISGKNGKGEDITESTERGKDWLNIRSVVSQWYQVLRMVAIIGLLLVLIYTGIKIIISANAKDKAKYKEWIMNWFMAVAILFSMHIIMAFVVAVTGELGRLMTTACQGIHVIPSNDAAKAFDTNLMGLVRFMIQSENFYIKVGYEVMYIALIWYTLKFTFTYLKRVLNVAFLTLIAPIVALTYPIDKINDGNAQGFNMWLKEYIFNALLQPMHCVLYYILVGSAVSIAASNPLYGIVVLAFMSEAEKLLKKIFGFDKAGGGTVGGMTNAFVAGTVASNLAKLAKLPKGNGKKGGSGGSGDSDSSDNYLDMIKDKKLGNDGNLEESFSDTLIDGGNGEGNDDENNGGDDNNTPNPAPGPNPEPGPNPAPGPNPDPNENDGTSNEAEHNSGSGQTGEADNSGQSEERTDTGTPVRTMAERRKAGLKNVGKKLIKPIYDAERKGTGYNRNRWKRRIGNGIKGLGKAYLGASLGIAAAAVQAGISITDGKYNPMEGVAAFTAGYAGGGRIAGSMGRTWSTLSNAYKEGYYEGNEKDLLEKRKEQFMLDDNVFKAYKKKYGDGAVDKMKKAADHMVEWGITDPKQQIGVEQMAQKLMEGKNTANMSETERVDLERRAYKQARDTYGFINQLEKQGVGKKIIKDPGAQDKYIDSYIKSQGYGKNDPEAEKIRSSLNNAFRSAAVWQQVNPKL